MSGPSNTIDLAIGPRPTGITITKWLYEEIRNAVLDGRLRRGAPIPPTRSIAIQHNVSRRIVVNVFDQLRDEGYLTALTGSGTRISANIPEDYLASSAARPPSRTTGGFSGQHARPFLPVQPSLAEFQIDAWIRLESRTLRRASTLDLADADPAGNPALRSAIAAHLGVSRGVSCSPDQIVITSGTQQSLDLLARVLVRPNDRLWIEDPGYKDAAEIFRHAGARVVPVPVDDYGVNIPSPRGSPPRAIYVTPAHQFPLGVSLRLDRRLELLRWTRDRNVMVIEDDYDSEFRFAGRPIPAMKGLAGSSHVFLLGTFNKALFPTLRIGYIVAPDPWLDSLLRLRRLTERFPAALPQRTLAAFIEEGHFARHLRRMRELYGARLTTLRTDIKRHLDGAVSLPEIKAGLNIPAFLDRSIDAATAAGRAQADKLEVWTLDRFALARRDLNGFLLGFAPFTEREIHAAVLKLARAIEVPPAT
jgi:GntR family transcriptional regulator/MocR family aminotransferase